MSACIARNLLREMIFPISRLERLTERTGKILAATRYTGDREIWKKIQKMILSYARKNRLVLLVERAYNLIFWKTNSDSYDSCSYRNRSNRQNARSHPSSIVNRSIAQYQFSRQRSRTRGRKSRKSKLCEEIIPRDLA